MISRSGSGNVASTVLYVSSLAEGPMIARLSAEFEDAGQILIYLNDGVITPNTLLVAQSLGANASSRLVPTFVMKPGDELAYVVTSTEENDWSFDLALYPQADVAYEAP